MKSNYSPTIFASLQQPQNQLFKDFPQKPECMEENKDRFGTMLGHLRQYTEIDDEEKKILNTKIDGLKDQLTHYKHQKTDAMGSGPLTIAEKKRMVILQNELKTLKYQIKTLEKEKEPLIKESELFKKEIRNLKKDKFDKISEVTNLKVEISQLENLIKSKYEAKLSNYKKLHQNLKIENESLANRFKVSEKKIQELENINEQLTDSRGEIIQENNFLKKSLIDNLEKLKELALENDRLKNTSRSHNLSSSPKMKAATSPKLKTAPSPKLKSGISPRPERIPESRVHHARLATEKPVISHQPIRLYQRSNHNNGVSFTDTMRRDLPQNPAVQDSESPTLIEPENEPCKPTKLLTVRIVGRRSMLKQCGFQFQVTEEDLEDTSFLFEKCCTKYCQKYGLNINGMEFTNYKGDKLSCSVGYPLENGDIIYVNYK